MVEPYISGIYLPWCASLFYGIWLAVRMTQASAWGRLLHNRVLASFVTTFALLNWVFLDRMWPHFGATDSYIRGWLWVIFFLWWPVSDAVAICREYRRRV